MTKSAGNEYSDDLTVPSTDSAGGGTNTEVTDTVADTAALDATASDGSEKADDTRAASDDKPTVAGSIAGSTWVGLTIGAVILILLLVFILQNQESVQLQMFIWQWNFPIGVGMLIAAIAGALVMACVGAVRILQLRRQINHPDNARSHGRNGRR
ncbi:lipopolysaccharide assembly protein LapA domain-containing protein [Corynebacterium sp. USCH3]|uniref:LapA family protein n=1 Tax=Corynebacterium sp. USCH3 TaxID=3024840 RepID=UPI0030A5365B